MPQHSEDREILLALVSFSLDAGDISPALEYSEQLSRLAPNDREVAELVKQLRGLMRKPEER